MGSEEGWHLVLVRPGKELQARNNFNRGGLRAYWPSYQPARSGVRRSVIPGYIFVQGPANAKFWDVAERIEDMITVARTYGRGLVLLRESDIQTIKDIEAGLDSPIPGKSLHQFKTGHKVRFKDGNWPPGIVAHSTGDGKLVVEVELMGRVVPIHIFPHQIEKG